MYFISIGGNLIGRNEDLEYKPEYIQKALDLNFFVIVDVYIDNDKSIFYLAGKYETNLKFLRNSKIICRAMNLLTLNTLLNANCHVYYDTDIPTISSHGLIIMPTEEYDMNASRSIVYAEEYNKVFKIVPLSGIYSNNIEQIKKDFYNIS